MTDSTNPTNKKLLPAFEAVLTAPIIYFDYVTTNGVLGGNIQIELAARVLFPLENGGVDPRLVEVGRLRCSPTAAKILKEALEGALRLLEQSNSPSMAGPKFN